MNFLIFCVSTVGLLSVEGWDAGSEYLYDYGGLLATSLQDAQHQAAAVQLSAKLTVQSIDDETLLLKMSEIRVTRDGNYSGRASGGSGGGGSSDPIWLPVLLADGEEEAVSDSLHLLSPFAVIHNKGSIINLVVEDDEPVWSVNIKKAVASHLQTDTSGLRSGSDSDAGVFGERNAALDSFEDGVTGDCHTTVTVTRLPFYQIIQTTDQHPIVNDLCRSSKIFELTKIKNFDQCRSDPLRFASNPAPDSRPPSKHGAALQRFAAYKYVTCGESSEKATIVRMEGTGQLLFSGPFRFKTEQFFKLILISRGQIHDILPSLTNPKVLDDLTFAFDSTQPTSSQVDEETVLKTLEEMVPLVTQSSVSDDDMVAQMSAISAILRRFDGIQLGRVWQRASSQLDEDTAVRDLFVDGCVASGGQAAITFVLELIERQRLKGLHAVWTLMNCGHSVQQADMPLLRKFVDVIRSEAAQVSKQLRRVALTTAADLLHRFCVVTRIRCSADTQIITEELIPLLVRELETAQSSSDRLTAILALGTLAVDDVLLLLVPYIRGEDAVTRIAAIFSLQRLMDSSSEKVIPVLSSLADNIAENPEIRMTAIGILLLHDETPFSVWQKMGARIWFEPSHQVKAFTCNLMRSLADVHPTEDESSTSSSSKARSLLALMHPPCSGRSEWHRHNGDATVKANEQTADGWMMSMLDWWRSSDSVQPVYLRHQLFRRLGSFRFDLAQVSIWNYNAEEIWNRLFGVEKPQAAAAGGGGGGEYGGGGAGPKLNDIWDQLSLRFRSEGQQLQAGLFHLRVLGTGMQTFINLDDIDRDTSLLDLIKEHLNIRSVKFQRLADVGMDVPTELGLPARFSFALSALFSIRGGSIHQSEINVTSDLLFKWTSQSSIECPFSSHYVASGVEHRAELHAPIHLIFNNSAAVWIPPEKAQDLAYYHVKPYTVVGVGVADNPSGIRLHLISIRPPTVSNIQLSSNLRLETRSEVAQVPVSASGWWKTTSWLTDALELNGLQPRAYRLRYVPKDGSFSSVSLSSAIHIITIRQDCVIDCQSAAANNSRPEQMPTTAIARRLLQGEMAALYSNDLQRATWSLLKFNAENVGEEGDVWNVTASGPSVDFVRSWINNADGFLQSSPTDSAIHFQIQQPRQAKCHIRMDDIVTFDGVVYNYTVNECHHLLTADCSRREASFAVTAARNESHGMIVRVTLDRNVIEVTSSGNVSINDIGAEFKGNRMRIFDGDHVVAVAQSKIDGSIHLRLVQQHLDISVQQGNVTLTTGRRLLGRVCGLCGDGDSETTGEFKTSDRCALSSGALMAASFQVSMGPDECPLLADELLQELLKESYPCYSVDEQVATVLPLPPES